MAEKGIRVIWRLSAVFVLFLLVAAYMANMALRPDPAVADDKSVKSGVSPKETIVQ